MTDETARIKLEHVLLELKRVALPQKGTPEYWDTVEVLCNNAADNVCDTDEFVKSLIQFIES